MLWTPPRRGIDGNDASTVFLLHESKDIGLGGVHGTVTPNGAAARSYTQTRFGEPTWNFNNSTSTYLSVPDDATLRFGTGNFTVEGWAYVSSFNPVNAFAAKRSSGGNANHEWLIGINNSGQLLWSDSVGSATSGATASTGSWFYWSWSRSSTTNYLQINGGAPSTFTNGNDYNDTSALRIGGDFNSGGSNAYNGFLFGARISKGVVRYTAAYSVPLGPLS